MQDYVRTQDYLPPAMAEQMVAHLMLSRYLLPAASPAMQAATARYARLLARNGTPEGNLLADALEASGPAL